MKFILPRSTAILCTVLSTVVLLVWIQREYGVYLQKPIVLSERDVTRTEANAAGLKLKALRGLNSSIGVRVTENQVPLAGPASSRNSLNGGSIERFIIKGEWLWIRSPNENPPFMNGLNYDLALPRQIKNTRAYSLYACWILVMLVTLWRHRKKITDDLFTSGSLFGSRERRSADSPQVPQPIAPAKNDRVTFLDGLRGWASVAVLLNHIIRGLKLETSTPAFGHWAMGLPMDGNMAVAIFFVLSGFALSIGFMSKGDSKILTVLALRRYPRLAIPIFFSCLLVYVLLRCDLFYNHEAAKLLGGFPWLDGLYSFEADLSEMVRYSFYDAFFSSNPPVNYNAVLWTMPFEFLGSMVVFSVLAIFCKLKLRVVLLTIFSALLIVQDSWYVAFLFGVMIAIYHCRPLLRQLVPPVFGVPIVVWVVFYSTATSGLTSLQHPRRSIVATVITAALLIGLVVCSDHLQSFFSNRISLYLGSISFPLYLIHLPIVCSWECWVWLRMPGWGISSQSTPWIAVLSTAVICLLGAHLFRYFEGFSIVSARRFSNCFK